MLGRIFLPSIFPVNALMSFLFAVCGLQDGVVCAYKAQTAKLWVIKTVSGFAFLTLKITVYILPKKKEEEIYEYSL